LIRPASCSWSNPRLTFIKLYLLRVRSSRRHPTGRYQTSLVEGVGVLAQIEGSERISA
jgi:hypothetical protein